MKRWCVALLGLNVACALSGAEWFVNPVRGDDAGDGSAQAPWRSFAPLNARSLGPGDVVRVVEPGTLLGSLAPKGGGSAEAPARIVFAPGEYEWRHEGLARHRLMISNTNDAPYEEKAVAMAFVGVRHLRVEGVGALLFARGRQVHLWLKDCEGVTFSGVGFDYRRPTVSEYTVERVGPTEAIVRVHPDSRFRLNGNRLVWVYDDGETDNTWQLIQRLDPATGHVCRVGGPAIDRNATAIEDLGEGRLRIVYSKNPGFEEGITYQHRLIRRDCAGVFCEDSRAITYENVGFHFMHGMGVVSQFSRDLTFRDCAFAPRPTSGRTCSAWADMLHFSGCAGRISVSGTRFSGANDDAINVHGTHLRLIRKEGDRRAVVRFMHGQSWGFRAFRPGDEVDFVSSETLVPYASGRLTAATLSEDGREMTLDFADPLPEGIAFGADVLENATWTPEVHVADCLVERIPTRGFLLTTRRPVVVERVTFRRTHNSAILVADDARSWFESGPVKDLTVRDCRFERCGEPVINVWPENPKADAAHPVHSGLKILNNDFQLASGVAVALKSAADVRIEGNRFRGVASEAAAIRQHACSRVTVRGNLIPANPETFAVEIPRVTYHDTKANQHLHVALLEGSVAACGKALPEALRLPAEGGEAFATPQPAVAGQLRRLAVARVQVPPQQTHGPLRLTLEGVRLHPGKRYTLLFGDAWWYRQPASAGGGRGYLRWIEFTADEALARRVEEGVPFALGAVDFTDAKGAETPLRPWP